MSLLEEPSCVTQCGSGTCSVSFPKTWRAEPSAPTKNWSFSLHFSHRLQRFGTRIRTWEHSHHLQHRWLGATRSWLSGSMFYCCWFCWKCQVYKVDGLFFRPFLVRWGNVLKTKRSRQLLPSPGSLDSVSPNRTISLASGHLGNLAAPLAFETNAEGSLYCSCFYFHCEKQSCIWPRGLVLSQVSMGLCQEDITVWEGKTLQRLHRHWHRILWFS